MSRRLAFTLIGTVVGAAGALWVWRLAQAELAAGVSEAGVGFGISQMLFLVSAPWSVAVWVAMMIIVAITGIDGIGGIAPFYAMPIVAGAGWGWLASYIRWSRWREPTRTPPVR
jgi:hypothetical protein